MKQVFPKPFIFDNALLATQDRAELCALLHDFIQQNIELIDRKLIRDLSYISQLAYYEKGMQVDEIKSQADGAFQMFFHYEWTIFQGCIGMHETGVMKDKVTFTLSPAGELLFDLTAFGALSTADEL